MAKPTTTEAPAATKTQRGPRSPNFPGITFSDALAKARVLYEQDKRAYVSMDTILTHLGFGKKLSGSSARVISALRQFNLLEEANDQYRTSDAAYKILTLSDENPTRFSTIQACVRKPAVYQKVLQRYPDGLPSDAALRDFLNHDLEFNPSSSDTFIRVFRASIAVAKLTPGAYTSGDSDDGAASNVDGGSEVDSSAGTPPLTGQNAIPPMTWVLSVPRGVRAELKIVGANVRREDLDRLKAQVDFLISSFTDESSEN